jgi:hypothetical protein
MTEEDVDWKDVNSILKKVSEHLQDLRAGVEEMEEITRTLEGFGGLPLDQVEEGLGKLNLENISKKSCALHLLCARIFIKLAIIKRCGNPSTEVIKEIEKISADVDSFGNRIIAASKARENILEEIQRKCMEILHS